MSRSLPLPYLASPPAEYDARYMNDLVRAVDQYFRLVQIAADETFTGVRITDLQEGDDYMLDAGVLFQIDGVVYVSRADVVFLRGSAATSGVGTVTVVTS